jgi:hypothetical protein
MKRISLVLATAALLFGVQAQADTAPTAAERQATIYQQLLSGSHGLTITFKNVHLKGSDVVGSVKVHWQETFFGMPVTIVDGTYPFATASVENILSTKIDLGWGAKVKIHLAASYQPVRQACLELRAVFLGGKTVEQRCTTIP